MIVVGLAAVGVNRFLSQSQGQVLSSSIAIIERAERVAVDVDLAASLADRLALAQEGDRISETTAALVERIAGIEADIEAMRRFLAMDATGNRTAEDARALARQMSATVRRLLNLETAVRLREETLMAASRRLAGLVSSETDVARLRITAGVWSLYAGPGPQEDRAALDRLADADFFSLERLGELYGVNAELADLVAETARAETAAALPALHDRFRDLLTLAEDRLRYMPSASARQAAEAELAILASGAGVNGLATRKAGALAARAQLADQKGRLAGQLDRLAEEAQHGRDNTRRQMQDQVAQAGRLATQLTAALAVITLAALQAGYLIWRRTRSHVVVRLGTVAERMVAVARGDIGQPLPISGQDEIGRLEKALNVLRRRARDAEQLRNRLEAAVVDRTADVVAEMQSANLARADAEEQSRAKTHFLARMSHEIRTPLNGLIGLLDLLTAEERDPARRARLDIALTSARDLAEMTEDILAFSAQEDRTEAARLEAFAPAALAQGLAEHLRVTAGLRGLAIRVDVSPDLPAALMGEPAKIRQIVINLLSNAVKYTEAGQVALVVSSRAQPEGRHEILFAVQDTGSGMTESEMRHAFDIYGRSISARRNGIRGVGLGLAIVRQLTDAMGGELRVSSAPGRGSSFTLVLSLAEAQADRLAKPEGVSLQGNGQSVLVVDDHPVNRLVARGYLERMGFAVTEAATGEEALAATAARGFDAILVDLGLPDMAGQDVLARMARGAARVGILTAERLEDDAATRARLGADRVLTKPISLRALVAFLSDLPATDAPQAAPPPLPLDLLAPSTAPSATSPLATETMLREDIASLGAETVAGIVDAFLEDLAAAVPALQAESDSEARRKRAHRIKGAASNFRLGDLCARLQKIEAGDHAALAGLAPAADTAARDLRAAAARAGLTVQPAGAAKQ